MCIFAVDDLRRQKAAFNEEFDKRMSDFEGGSGKKPRRSNYPQQKYACCCPTMRTYREDVLSSTCKDCKQHGKAIPSCRSCKCQCQTGIFLEKDTQAMVNEKVRQDKLKARKQVPNTDHRAMANFGTMLASSVSDGFKLLSDSKSSLDETNVLSSAAGRLSRMQMPSEEELHSLQQIVPLSTKLQGTGKDVREVLNASQRKNGKRHYQNNLR